MARLGRSFPNNLTLRKPLASHTLITASQVAFVRSAGVSTIQQPLYVGGAAFPLVGSVPLYGNGIATLTGQQPVHAPVVMDFVSSLPLYGGGAAVGFVGSQPAYGVTRNSLAGSQPLFVKVRDRMITSQALFAPVGAIIGTQAMMVRGFPDLTVTPNIVQQQYAPVQVVEITL